MIRFINVHRSWVIGALSLGLGACGAAPTPPSNVPVVEPPPVVAPPPTPPVVGAPVVVPLIAEAGRVKTDDDDHVKAKIAELINAPEAKCSDVADALDSAFEQQKASSRTVCDQRSAQGIGIKGDELVKATDARLKAIAGLLKASKADKRVCFTSRAELVDQVSSWRSDRDVMCAAATAAPSEHGSGADAESRDASGMMATGLETSLLRGTAEFFEARAKSEAKLFAYDVVTDRLCSDEQVKAILVNACELFDNDDELAATPATIQQAVRADFEQLPEKLVAKIADPKLKCGAALSWAFSKEAVEGADVLDLLANPDPLLADPLVEAPTCGQDVHTRIRQAALELKKLLDQNRGAVEKLVKAGRVERAVVLGGSERGIEGNLNAYGDVLKKVLLRVRVLDEAHRAWKKDPSPKTRAAVVIAGLRTVEPLLAFAIQDDRAHRVGKGVEKAIELSGEIVNREYSAAVVTAAELSSLAGLSNGRARNLLGLAAGLAQAESSDEVRATIEDAALPLGSWRRKNEKRFGATLTGLVGVQVAHEIVVQKSDRGGDVQSGPSVAPSLLVGADIHGGLGGGFRIGAQLSLLDLGALLSFRTSKPKIDAGAGGTETETAEQQPEVRVVQVVSPGIYPYLGIGPFDIGAGVSFVPALRSVSGAGQTDGLDVMRIGGFVAVDVSVLPLL